MTHPFVRSRRGHSRARRLVRGAGSGAISYETVKANWEKPFCMPEEVTFTVELTKEDIYGRWGKDHQFKGFK